MEKKQLRNIYREKRKALSNAEREKMDDLMLIEFQTINLPFLHTMLSFWPIEQNQEPNTSLITDFLEFRNPALRIAYPKINSSSGMFDAVEVHTDTAFRSGKFNVEEPVDGNLILPMTIDLVLVPLLAFDLRGYRVGYGKGFYDQFLGQCDPACIRVGLSYFDPVDEISDAAEFDVPLTHCITPHDIYVF
jgi:5-formyltetrahydrofolate cyclo-ligase